MRRIYLIALLAGVTACSTTDNSEKEEKVKRKEIVVDTYPDVKKDQIVDDYFGVEVSDPYRWLENDTSQETAHWVKEQNLVTFNYLAQIPYRDQIKDRLTTLFSYERQSIPFKRGDNYFFYKNNGTQNQSVLYFQKDLDAEPIELLDPNNLSESGTTAINGMGFSEDGRYMAYGISHAGSDWVEINVLDLETQEPLNDVIKNVKFSPISWQNDGFYYSAYELPTTGSDYSGKNEFHTVYYHKLGTPQAEDQLIYRDEDNPLRNARATVTKDRKFLSISTSSSTNGNGLYLKDLESDGELIASVEHFENDNHVLKHLGGGKLLLLTNYKAPNKRICILDVQQPQQKNWEEFIPEKEYTLTAASITSDKIFLNYMKDVQSKIEVYNMEGEYLYDLELPGIGMASFSGNEDSDTAFYSFTSYTTPTSTYLYNIKENTSELYFEPKTDFNSEEYVTEQVFYKSKDGTKVPLFITHKKGIKKDGSNPTMLYGYGGFNISVTPSFSSTIAVFLEQGGIYAVANLRGGSEYGEDWHTAGWRLNKQNVFDDFIAAAEYLKDKKYTSTEKLAIHGRSNGGLLAAAVMVQRPDLMKVVLPGVGVLDMLRYHKFTIGWAWAGEYGDSEESQESFENLYAYSPLHNIKEDVEYPATLVTTADHDDRVVPAHSFKFISELQAKQAGEEPVLIRVDVNAGHGAGKPISKSIEEWADIWSFVLWNTHAETNFK